uniref:Uncharacterized protein n=1 Tax=Pristionchus pacificus TaxID=54126 RepID=A0A8R1UKZ6_PRIPA
MVCSLCHHHINPSSACPDATRHARLSTPTGNEQKRVGDKSAPFSPPPFQAKSPPPHLRSRLSTRSIQGQPNRSSEARRRKKRDSVKNAPRTPVPPSRQKKPLSKKNSKTLEDKRSSSSDHESDNEGSIKFLQADLIKKVKKYDKAWFEHTAEHDPGVFVDTKQYAFFERIRKSQSIRGFSSATFGLSSTVFYSNADCLHYIDIDGDNPRVEFMKQSGEVTCLTSSPDHSFLAFGINDHSNEGGGAAIRVLDASTMEAVIDVSHPNKVTSMCISQGSESLVALSEASTDMIKLTVFDMKQLKQSAIGDLVPNTDSARWEISFCPADEGIVCVFGGDYAYLLRVLNGYVDKFSQIHFDDVTCHSWASDVTMAFGTTRSSIRLYRETLPLQVVDLSESYAAFVNSEIPECSVVAMTFTIRKFAVATQNGILLVFPMHEGNPQWEEAISIVNLVYTNGKQLLVSCLRHINGTMKDGGRIVTVKHLKEVTNASISNEFIATLDGDGDIVISARNTGRIISYSQIKDVLGIFFTNQLYQLVVVTKLGVTAFEVAFHALEPREDLIVQPFVYCCSNHCRSLVALFQSHRFDIYNTTDFSKVCGYGTNLKKVNRLRLPNSTPSWWSVADQRKRERLCEMKRVSAPIISAPQGISKAVFADTDDFLTVLGVNDQIFVYDCRRGDLVWCVETKLQFYTDILHVGNNAFVLNKRFAVTRFRNGKDFGQLSMHTSTLGYQSSSHLLAGRGELAFLGTACGQLLVSRTADIEDPELFMQHCHYPLSYLSIHNDNLIIGSRTGCVVVVCLETSAYEPLHHDDYVLWPHSRIYNFTYLIQEIDLERNIIRKETDSFVKAYTKRRDEEVEKLREECDRSVKGMKERVKKIEEAFEMSEQEKQATIANLKKLYEDEFAAQHAELVKQMDESFEGQRADMIASFHETEHRIVVQKKRVEDDLKQKQHELEEERRRLERAMIQMNELQNEHSEENMNQRRREEIRILESELWNEKATSVQLGEQRDRAQNECSKEKTAVLVRDEKISEIQDDLTTTTAKCAAMMAELDVARRTEFQLRLANKTITASLNSKSEELEKTRVMAHRYERHLREVEARLDDISKCVYNARVLEHKVLGLLAYVNAHPHHT